MEREGDSCHAYSLPRHERPNHGSFSLSRHTTTGSFTFLSFTSFRPSSSLPCHPLFSSFSCPSLSWGELMNETSFLFTLVSAFLTFPFITCERTPLFGPSLLLPLFLHFRCPLPSKRRESLWMKTGWSRSTTTTPQGSEVSHYYLLPCPEASSIPLFLSFLRLLSLSRLSLSEFFLTRISSHALLSHFFVSPLEGSYDWVSCHRFRK